MGGTLCISREQGSPLVVPEVAVLICLRIGACLEVVALNILHAACYPVIELLDVISIMTWCLSTEYCFAELLEHAAKLCSILAGSRARRVRFECASTWSCHTEMALCDIA